jgi:hypothetical protein
MEYPVPTLALMVEFDRILTGEAQQDDEEYHELVLNAIRVTLLRRDHTAAFNERLRAVLERLTCAKCQQGFNTSGAPGCVTHISVRLILDDVAYRGHLPIGLN